MRKAALIAMALAVVCATPVFAGGGGAKRNANLRVNNTSGAAVAVLVDADANTQAFFAVAGNATQANLTNAGGRVVAAGRNTTFLVTPNTLHTVTAVFVADAATGPDFAPGGGDDASVVVGGNASALGKITGGPGSTTTFTVGGAAGAAPGATLAWMMIDLSRDLAIASFGLSGLGIICLAGYMLNRKKA